MINIQKYIGQPIISLESKKIIGTLNNFTINKNKIDKFIAFNDKEDVEFIFLCENVLNLGEDAIIIKNEENLVIQDNIHSPTILGLPIYNQKGKLLGTAKDLELTDNFTITQLVYKNNKIPFNQIENINKEIILLKGPFRFRNRKINNSKFDYLVKIQNKISLPKSLPLLTQNIKTEPLLPSKTTASASSLIGKTLTKDISFKGKTIIKAGTIITQKVIDLSNLSGTIKELTFNVI